MLGRRAASEAGVTGPTLSRRPLGHSVRASGPARAALQMRLPTHRGGSPGRGSDSRFVVSVLPV